jgi:hypothetical protein
MNIRLIHSVIRRNAARALAIAAATAMTTFSVGAVTAQTGLVNPPAGGPGATTANRSGSFLSPGTRVIPASAVRTAADVAPQSLSPGAISLAVANTVGDGSEINFGDVAQVGFGCQSCSRGSCNGGCGSGSHGVGGWGHSSRGASGNGGYNVCGTPCEPYYYVNIEGLYLDRKGISNRSLTRNTRLGDPDFEWAPRITFGMLPNCVNGYEFTFVGKTTWEDQFSVSSPEGRLNSLLVPTDGFDPSNLAPFYNSNFQTIAHSSTYRSAELNRTLVGWDVAKVLCGGRYIGIEDTVVYAARKDSTNSYGDLTARATNDLIGFQAGLDLMYPLTRHLYGDFRGRAGLFVDLADGEVRLRNNGDTVLWNFSDATKIAGVFEFGGGLRYQLGEILSIRAGGEMWYLTDYASGPDQVVNGVSSRLGSSTQTDDVFYYGGTVGLELRY